MCKKCETDPEGARKDIQVAAEKMIASTDHKVMLLDVSLPLAFVDNPGLGSAVAMAFESLKRDIVVMQGVLRGIADPASIELSAEERAKA